MRGNFCINRPVLRANIGSPLIGLVFRAFHRAKQRLLAAGKDMAAATYPVKSIDWAAIPERAGSLALFDCRVWAVPNEDEAANAFLWRELNATKNSVSMAARAYYAHGEFHDRTSSEMQEMLFSERGINFNDYPASFKRGTYVQRRLYEKTLDEETLARIPPGKRPTGSVMRSEVAVLELPPLAKVANRVAVLMDAEPPARGEG